MKKLIDNGLYRYDFLLCDAGEVVIKCTSVDDILCCLADISGLVNECRRIAGACTDASLTGGKNRGNYARAAGCYQKVDIRMFHHDTACLECGLLNGNGDVVRAACLE